MTTDQTKDPLANTIPKYRVWLSPLLTITHDGKVKSIEKRMIQRESDVSVFWVTQTARQLPKVTRENKSSALCEWVDTLDQAVEEMREFYQRRIDDANKQIASAQEQLQLLSTLTENELGEIVCQKPQNQ